MIIILTGGTPISNSLLLSKLEFPFTLIDNHPYAAKRSTLESFLPSQNNFIIPCSLKSHRYEIHRLARRFNHPFYILLDTSEDGDFEELNGTYDKPVVCDYEIEKLVDKSLKFKNMAHTKKSSGGDYMQQVMKTIKSVNEKYESLFVKECEKRMINMVNKSVIDIKDVADIYESIIKESSTNHEQN